MASAVSVARTNNPEIDGLLSGSRWSGTVTDSFPDSPSDYPASYSSDGEPTTAGFATAPVAMQTATNYAVALISSYTNYPFNSRDRTAPISRSPNRPPPIRPPMPIIRPMLLPAATYGSAIRTTTRRHSSGTITSPRRCMNSDIRSASSTARRRAASPVSRCQQRMTIPNITVMSYRSYAGAPLTGYTAEAYGYAQTYMANDILALQTLYGANFATHSENTVTPGVRRPGSNSSTALRNWRRARLPAARQTASSKRCGTATASTPTTSRTTRRR